jgi:hypothetical protein
MLRALAYRNYRLTGSAFLLGVIASPASFPPSCSAPSPGSWSIASTGPASASWCRWPRHLLPARRAVVRQRAARDPHGGAADLREAGILPEVATGLSEAAELSVPPES